MLRPDENPGHAMVAVYFRGGRKVVPVLEPMEDATSAADTPRHRVHPAVDRVVVCAEETGAEFLVAQAIMEDAPRHPNNTVLK